MRYRRSKTPGAIYFFTVNLADRKQALLTEHIEDLRAVMKSVKQHHPFTIDAMVILPEHLHAIWTLPQNDYDFAARWSLIKSGFSRGLPKDERISESRLKKRERGIWQRRYWEHQIRDEEDFANHIDYVHYNPVKHGYVKRCIDWSYSSFHKYVREGWLPENWAGIGEIEGAFGE